MLTCRVEKRWSQPTSRIDDESIMLTLHDWTNRQRKRCIEVNATFDLIEMMEWNVINIENDIFYVCLLSLLILRNKKKLIIIKIFNVLYAGNRWMFKWNFEFVLTINLTSIFLLSNWIWISVIILCSSVLFAWTANQNYSTNARI